MKAWVYSRYGGPEVLRSEERPLPEVRDDEVLVKIRATTVSTGDMRVRSLKLPRGFAWMGRLIFGFSGPRQPILGTDFAGTVVAIGRKVSAFRVGDDVIGYPGGAMRSHAEYRSMRVGKALVLKPPQLSFAQAASLPFGGMTALSFLCKAKLQAGETLLVIGASGAVGSAFVQLGRQAGAMVTGVATSRNHDLVRSLGATDLVDYTLQDYTQGPQRYDVIADTVGASTFAKCWNILAPHGRYIAVAGDLSDLVARRHGEQSSIAGPSSESLEDLQQVVELAQSGAIQPVIDRTFSFEQMPQAHAYVDTGRKRGSVVVEVV
ncbi:NAD(P)-dependent alcohol dehydrogenase [Rhodoferax aquaticus]|uniref:NAD(P)-dependent alcohol dehydrogenase n=2 Tax=Rhodoferax aquaticus TaxID=2527691 RepID=A0A515EVK5_9BURK|nr:NAD(P)-dependent alcohol dehydrogenase [Rhodoferax aquaticus]